MKKIAGVILLSLAVLSIKATHITHGNISYEYLGKDGFNNSKYKIILSLYRDCIVSTVPFDDTTKISVYEDISGKPLYKLLEVGKNKETDAKSIEIGKIGFNMCVRKAIYTTEVSLASASTGYYIVWQQCCKDAAGNLEDDNSFCYMAFIPSEANNAACLFSDVPVAATINTTISIGLGSYDKDRDSITYELTDILHGYVPPPFGGTPDSLPFPDEKAQYRSGFSGTNPLGIYGTTTLSHDAGVLKVKASKQGRYFIGVKVSEWRNGALLTENVREFMFLFLNGGSSDTSVALASNGGERKEVLLGWGVMGDSLQLSDINTFTIERKETTASAWGLVATVNTNTLGYSDTTIMYDIAYDYRITANLKNSSKVVSNTDDAIVRSWKTNSTRKTSKFFYKIYPNPVTSKLLIEANGTDISILEVQIFDQQGKVVETKKFDKQFGQNEIEVDELTKGVYVLRIISSDGVSIQKFIKQ